MIGRRELLQRGAAVTAIAIVGLPMGIARAAISPEQRIRNALEEAKAAFEAYYGAAGITATYNEAKPSLLKDGSVGCMMILASGPRSIMPNAMGALSRGLALPDIG